MIHQTTFAEVVGNPTEIEAKHAPAVLYYAGNLSLLAKGRRVAVIGSRKVSAEGIKRAQTLTKAIVKHGIVVVSGLAAGVDTVAHQKAIACSGKTISVLGTPLN